MWNQCWSSTSTPEKCVSVPLSQTDFAARVGAQALLEGGGVGGRATLVPVVIRIDHLGPKSADGIGGLVDGHGEGSVHTNEGHIDVRKGEHLGNIVRVAAHIDALVPDGDDISVAAAARMVLVISGNRLDF